MRATTIFYSRALFFGTAIVLVCLGNGCLRASAPSLPLDPLANLVAATNDQIMLSQAMVREKAIIPVKRQVTIRGFQPGKQADFDWKVLLGEGTASSTWLAGSVRDIVLRTSYLTALPGSWQGDRDLVHERGALWLGDDEYQELVATKVVPINPDLQSAEWRDVVKDVPEAKRALAALSQLAMEASAKNEIILAKQQGEVGSTTLRINGQDKTVPIRTVKNWFGTFTILDHRQDPLLLSFTLQPDADPKRFSLNKKDETALATLLNYHVTEITSQSMKASTTR